MQGFTNDMRTRLRDYRLVGANRLSGGSSFLGGRIG
jgi:hypothetical protein